MAGKKYEVYVQKGRPWWKILTGLIFSHLGLFFICILYAVVGAYAFIVLEKENEDEAYALKLKKSKDVDEAVKYLKSIFWQYANNKEKYNYTRNEFRDVVYMDLDTLKKFVISYHNDYNYDMTEDWEYDWTFPKAFLFTVTIMTTIGYGHIFPTTFYGKLFCMIYSIVGIPLLLVFMADIGDLLAKGVRYSYSRICCRWCRTQRRDQEMPPDVERSRKAGGLFLDEIGKESYMPTDSVNVPVMVNLMLIFGYLFLGAVLFSAWEGPEGWDLTSSFYFCFVTLTTIGFGDMVPNKSFVAAGERGGFLDYMKMMFVILYCIFGMTLISMCINLMSEQLTGKAKWVATELGMGGGPEPDSEEWVKIHKEGKLQQTPEGMTGNELDFNSKRRKATGEAAQENQEDSEEVQESDEEYED